MLRFEDLTYKKKAVAAIKCKKSLLFHTRFFFTINQKRKFIVNHHHVKIAEALEAKQKREDA